MTPAFKEILRQQRQTVFGHRRYWLHIGLWLLVLVACVPYSSDFSRGLVISIGKPKPDSSAQKSVPGKPVSGIAADGTTTIVGDPASLLTDSAIGVAVGAIVVYTFLLWIIPYARYRRKKRILIWAIVLVVAGLLIFLIGSVLAWGIAESIHKAGPHASASYQPLIHLILASFLVFIIVGAFFSGYYFVDLYDQQKALNRYRDVFTAKMQAETAFLKMQINPHFLFNSLNNIYALTLTQSAQAPVLARRLQELLQYMLADGTREMVSLSGELTFLQNYISLEQLRTAQDQVQIDYRVQGNPEGLSIAPLLLVNFIENAFKHGVKAGITAAVVRVQLTITGRLLAVSIFNTKPPAATHPEQAVRDGGGIGVQNVKRRLQILYPGRHTLRIHDTPESHSVSLNIQL
ncbi:MAG: hypothetical protein EOP52_09610 [Sphingobacteriales bacterium]|nr:MAG: hypothetical protein EOP52_09610 [Sphingobacteriales bacterium]